MFTSKRTHQGMTLLEVLIALVILSVGLLGIAGALLIANKANNSSYLKQFAVQSAYNMFDRMKANSTVVSIGSYNASNTGTNGFPTAVSSPSVLCNSSNCTSAQLANYDVWQWLTQEVAQLPSGSGSITTSASPVAGTLVTITIQWDDSPASSRLGNNGTRSTSNTNFVQLSIQSEL